MYQEKVSKPITVVTPPADDIKIAATEDDGDCDVNLLGERLGGEEGFLGLYKEERTWKVIMLISNLCMMRLTMKKLRRKLPFRKVYCGRSKLMRVVTWCPLTQSLRML